MLCHKEMVKFRKCEKSPRGSEVVATKFNTRVGINPIDQSLIIVRVVKYISQALRLLSEEVIEFNSIFSFF